MCPEKSPQIFWRNAYCAYRKSRGCWLELESADNHLKYGFMVSLHMNLCALRMIKDTCIIFVSSLCTLTCTVCWFSESHCCAQRFCSFSNIPLTWCVQSHLLRQVWLWTGSQRYWMLTKKMTFCVSLAARGLWTNTFGGSSLLWPSFHVIYRILFPERVGLFICDVSKWFGFWWERN